MVHFSSMKGSPECKSKSFRSMYDIRIKELPLCKHNMTNRGVAVYFIVYFYSYST